MSDFELTNSMLEEVFGGKAFSPSKVFSFTGAYAQMQAVDIAVNVPNCACGCSCTDGAGCGSGSGV